VTFQAEAEFPFVADMPKREKSRWQRVWEQFQTLQRISAQKGTLVPPALAAKLLGVSTQRVYELMNDGLGRFERVEVEGSVFVTEKDLLAFCDTERKAGRPTGPSNMREVVKIAVGSGVDTYRTLRSNRRK